MAAHRVCFDFYYQPKPRQTGLNGCQVFVDTRLDDFEALKNWTKRESDETPV
jgi:hypothetical protein